MKKILVVLAAAVMSASLSYAQKSWESNPCASKGKIVAPVLSSSIVDEIVIVSDNPGEWKFSASVETEGGKEIVSIVMDAPQPCAPARFNVYFTFPQKECSTHGLRTSPAEPISTRFGAAATTPAPLRSECRSMSISTTTTQTA